MKGRGIKLNKKCGDIIRKMNNLASPMSSTRVAGNPMIARYIRKVFGSSSDFEPSRLTTLMRMSSSYELITDPSLQ